MPEMSVGKSEASSPDESASSRTLTALVWVVVLAAFAPALWWITSVAIAREQIRDAAIVLLFALFVLMRERRDPARWVLSFGPVTSGFVAGACLAAGASSLLHQPLLLMAALGLLAGGILLFLFGDEFIRLATGLAVAFTGFTILAVILPLADLPLRIFAGKTAMALLDTFGAQAALGFAGDPPKLILISNGHPFEVAPECNGFGITSSCILLGLLLAFSRRLRVLDKTLIVLLSPLLGLFSNAIRIMFIVLLAPNVGPKWYDFMHEAVGITMFLATLAAVWWLVSGLPERRPQMKSAIS